MSGQMPRNRSLDMAKGLMILWVPFVHLIRLDLVPVTTILVPEMLFSSVMISYFLLSGYVYKPGKRSWTESVKHYAALLLKPLVIWCLVILIADALWLILNGNGEEVPGSILSWLKSIMNSQGIYVLGEDYTSIGRLMHSQMVAYWFIGSMMLSQMIFFAAAPLVTKSSWGTLVLAVVLLGLSGVLRVVITDDTPFTLQELPAWTAIELLGCLAGKLKFFEKCPLKKKGFLLSCIPLLAALWYLDLQVGFGSDLGNNAVWCPIVKVVMGFMQLYIIIFGFQLLKETNPVGRFFGWLGRNTLTILLCHMLIGTLVSLITHLYSLGTWTILNPNADIFSAPANAIPQGFCLWTITVSLSLLLCYLKGRIHWKSFFPAR